MDIPAIKECMDNKIEIAVINFENKENLIKVLNGEKEGTRIKNEL